MKLNIKLLIMKRTIKGLLILCLSLATTFGMAQSKKEIKAENDQLKAKVAELEKKLADKTVDFDPNSENHKFSYAVGVQAISNFKLQGIDTSVSPQIIAKGMMDFQADSSRMTEAEVNTVMQEFTVKIRAAQQAAAERQATENKEKGEKFLAENGKRPEVKTTSSGLQYEILKEGTGAVPKASDRVKTHYTGTLLDGTKFDSSVDRGVPFEANAGSGLIQGWIEALQMMPVGSKWKLYVPSDLAYGTRGGGSAIGPNETLIFEMELLEILDPSNSDTNDHSGHSHDHSGHGHDHGHGHQH